MGIFDKINPFAAHVVASAPTTLESERDADGILWSIDGESWGKVFSHQFIVEETQDPEDFVGPLLGVAIPTTTKSYYFTLPIPPQSVSIEPILPGSVTPTIGGVVEEISAVSLWRISLSGTMGIAPSRETGDMFDRKKTATVFRTRIATTGLLAGLSASVQATLSKATGVFNAGAQAVSAVDGFNLDSAGAIAGGVTGALNNALLPPIPFSSSAVDGDSNGFTETQELQKFFYLYSYLKAQNPKKYNLFFANYKTNQKWQVQVKKYPIRQSAANPNLYRYDIQMIGWNCEEPDAALGQPVDRFGPKGDLASVNTVGLAAIGQLKSISGGITKKSKGQSNQSR